MSIQDSLKSAAEKFVIDFPEFEDLDLDDLYKEMKKKGYFGDERKYDKKAKGGEVKKYNKGGIVKRYKGGLMVKPKAAKRGY